MRKIFFYFFLLLLFSCEEKSSFIRGEEAVKIYKEKGVDSPGYFKPEIVVLKQPLYGIYEIGMENCFLSRNNRGEYCIGTIKENGSISAEPVLAGFPPYSGEALNTDPWHNIVWQKEGRYVRVLELDTKNPHGFSSTGKLGGSINLIFLADPEKNILFIELVNYQKHEIPYCFYVLYDMNKKKIIYTSPYINPEFVGFNNGDILHNEWISNTEQKWYIKDLYLNNKRENDLTRELTRFKIHIPVTGGRAVNLNKRMMLGVSRQNNDSLTQYMIKWDEDCKNVSIEPLLNQVPKLAGLYESAPVISKDGNWVKMSFFLTDSLRENFPIYDCRTLFHHIGSQYPQNLSSPIIGAYNKRGSTGAFVLHTELGPLYVEQDFNFPDKLFIYKLLEISFKKLITH